MDAAVPSSPASCHTSPWQLLERYQWTPVFSALCQRISPPGARLAVLCTHSVVPVGSGATGGAWCPCRGMIRFVMQFLKQTLVSFCLWSFSFNSTAVRSATGRTAVIRAEGPAVLSISSYTSRSTACPSGRGSSISPLPWLLGSFCTRCQAAQVTLQPQGGRVLLLPLQRGEQV